MKRHCGFGTGTTASLGVVMLLLLSPALVACGGSSTKAATSPSATPFAAATPVALVGSDSVAVTQRVVDLARAALHAPTAAKLARPYADDVVVDDFTFNGHFTGKAAVVGAFRANLRGYSGARWVAGYAGRGWAVIEERWDFTKTNQGEIELVAVQETRGGKVVYEGDYYQYGDLPTGTPLQPKPLTSAPGPADTPAAAAGVALQYAAALQAQDAAAMAALSAPTIAFMDTASSTVGDSPGQVQAHYVKIFTPPSGWSLNFTQLRYAFGAGWAAVLWTAGGDGVTMLEIRDGRIARETLYYNRGNVLFVP